MRRRREENEADADNFFVSWGDLVTLLLVFFVYLFSISEIDVIKFLEAKDALGSKMDNPVQSEKIEKMKLEQEKLQEMQEKLEEYIETEELEDVVDIEYLDDRLELNFGNALLFTTGSSELKKKALEVMTEVSNITKEINSIIVVEGHTDNIPIKTDQFPSNWELSSARAASVVRSMIAKGVPARRFVVIGYHQYKPLVPNNSVQNRAKNRRVKITIKPDIESLLSESRRGDGKNA